MTTTPPQDQVPASFRCDMDANGRAVRIVPVGELDLATVGEVDDRLRQAREAGFREVVLDLRGVSFMDCSGVRLVVAAHTLSCEDGTSFALIAGPDCVQRVLHLVGVLDILSLSAPTTTLRDGNDG